MAGLVERVVARLRAGGPGTAGDSPAAEPVELEALERRLERLEQALEGLQDSVHRESHRRDEEIAELKRQVQPHTMARSLSDDARKRGL